MSSEGTNYMSLVTIAGGVAEEKFQRELARVAENIGDVNTRPDQKRTITLKITFDPAENREDIRVIIEASSKLVAPRAHGTQAFLGKLPGGKPVIVDINPRQLALPGTGATTNVHPMPANSED